MAFCHERTATKKRFINGSISLDRLALAGGLPAFAGTTRLFGVGMCVPDSPQEAATWMTRTTRAMTKK